MKSKFYLLLPFVFLLACQTEEIRSTYSIRGYVGYDPSYLALLEGFNVTLMSDNQVIASTNENPFEFTKLEEGRNYTVTPSAQGDPKSGVSTLDFVTVQQFIKGNKKFNAFTRIAADMNLDGAINPYDLDRIQSCIVTGVCPTYRFASPDYNGFGKGFVDKYTIANLDSDKDIQFYPIKIGDVNNTISPH